MGRVSLKDRIKQDLHIDVAFPFVAAGHTDEATACCVVDTDWLDTVQRGVTDDSGLVLVHTPSFTRYTTGEAPQKQAPTTNILVTALPKTDDALASLALYRQTMPDQQHPTSKTAHIHWPLTTYLHDLIEGKDEQELPLTDVFSSFDSVFDGQELTPEERAQMFISRIHAMLWPQSPVYRVVKSDAPDDQQRRQLILQPISTRDDAHSDDNDDVHVSNANLLDVFAIVDAPSAYYLLSSYHGTTLQDLIKYNPGILHSNIKKGFIIYQLLRILASLHHRGIVHGSLKTSDIFVNENMWIQVAGLQCSSSSMAKVPADTKERYSIGTMPMPKTIQQEPLVMQWVRGEISNYSYLMILNALAGRREGDPNFHPILPWVTDFSGDTIEDGWRDFTKTKFRMNKGDEQLDFTFDGPMPHHITDILSDITYYVYLARRTPIAVLCQFVRSKYEPNEYPSSMERLYHWTPDECIPEFYTDPSIFKSIHDDMPDLQLPRWAASPEDFVAQHAKALESEFVSSHLHHWIDLTFGKHLTGKEGIESKNVALPLLAGQNTFMKHGIVQLFQANHPQRGCNWSKSRRQFDHQHHQDIVPNLVTMETSSSEQSSSTTPQRTLRANNNLSPLPAISKSIVDSPPSMTVGTTRDHAISVHSTASSSLDTSSLSTHTKNMSMDASSSIANANANATPAIGTSHHAASLSSSLRSDPIRLPTDMPDDYFTENLNHYEQTMNFAASYRGDMEGAGATDADALPTHAFLPPNTARYNIDPDSHAPLPTNKFSMETAHDMHSLGVVMQELLLCRHTQSKLTFNDDHAAIEVYGDDWIVDANHEFFADHISADQTSISPDVQGVIDALQSPQWYERPTAKSILLASFSSTTLQHPRFSLPLDSCIPDMYEFQAAFYQAEWSRRLYLADKWIDRICDMDGESFMLILPSFVQLFSRPETRIGSIGLFSKLAYRLGIDNTRKHLLKPIIAMFETLRPQIPKVLFDAKVIKDFVHGLGIPLFLQQLLPCYIEALAIDDASVQRDDTAGGTLEGSVGALSPKPMATLAANSLLHICQLLGPILTSKHIIRQLVKLLFRDDSARPVLMRVVVSVIGNLFGDTFTAVQHTYLISLLELPSASRPLTERQGRVNEVLLTLLSELLPLMSAPTILNELRSGFMATLYKLLDPAHAIDAPTAAMTPLQLTLSMNTIQYHLRLADRIPLVDWEALVIPTLRKYFSGFTSTMAIVDDGQTGAMDPQKVYQMMYAYSKLCEIIGKSTMHRLIPTSAAIEKMMYEEFAMELSPVSSADSSSDTASKTARLTVAEPVLASGSNSIKSKRSISSFADETALPPPLLLDASRLHACATKDLLVFRPIASALPPLQKPPLGTSIEPIASDAASHVPTSAKSPEKDSPSNKNKLSSSVFPWKTKWKPSVEDKNNWNRFLSTNSEEMSKSMQFSFNDLKLRGFAGHTSAVKSFAVNEAVKLFASGSKDKTVKLWSLNVHEGIENWETEPYSEALLTYTGHRRGPIHDLHFLSTDLIASCDGQVHLWHPETGKPIHQFITGRAPIVSVKPFQHHVNMIGATADGYLIFLDEHNQQVMQTWKVNAGVTNGSIRNIAINTSGTRVAIGHSNGMISLLETRTGMLVDCWKGGDAEISQLKFYANDVLVTCAPADHMICCWNVNRLKLTKTISASLDVLSMNLFKDEILAINGNNSVSFIPINEELQSYSSKFKSSIFKSQVTAFTPVPADQLLLFGCAEGEIFLYA